MINAILTHQGAKRLNVIALAGKVVQVDRMYDNLLANDVFYKGDKLGSRLSISGQDQGLVLCPWMSDAWVSLYAQGDGK